MQDESADGLGQQTRGEGGDGTAGAAEGADDAEPADLVAAAAGQVAGEDGGGAGVDRAQEQADDGERYGLARHVGHPPDKQLEDSRADREGVHCSKKKKKNVSATSLLLFSLPTTLKATCIWSKANLE